uniref:Choline/carnitine acyltransferase domain-containing protein n=1 Tax=Eptatretus burgeri TaxID=7764 RepID=A0A8C4QGS2_EPTBU
MPAPDLRFWAGQTFCALPLRHSGTVVVCEAQTGNYHCMSDGKYSPQHVDHSNNIQSCLSMKTHSSERLSQHSRMIFKNVSVFTQPKPAPPGVTVVPQKRQSIWLLKGPDDTLKQKVSPDDVPQLALQLAFLRLYGTPADTYESCSTAAFRHGRTETIRSASRAAIDCCHAFFARSPFQASSLRPLVEASCLHHGQLTKEAAMGQGFDRHLFALRHLAMQQIEGDKTQVPGFYQNPAYARFNHIILSTSTLSSDAVALGGFAPVTSDGLGVAYGIHNDWIGCNVSAYTSQNIPDFLQALDVSLQEIGDVLPDTSAKPNSLRFVSH